MSKVWKNRRITMDDIKWYENHKNKSILLSIKPQYVAKILNGEKTIEIRKHAIPVGTKVYIYCTKYGLNLEYADANLDNGTKGLWVACKGNTPTFNGKVVASFVVSKCEDIKLPYTFFGNHKRVNCEQQRKLQTKTMNEDTLLKKSCLTEKKLYVYLNFKKSPDYCGSAWHISQLHIFDRPKDLSEFSKPCNFIGCKKKISCFECDRYSIKKAPQSYCYVEEVE